MSDIIDRLRNPLWTSSEPAWWASNLSNNTKYLDEKTAIAVMEEAADEIERLRTLVGTVSAGPSFAEIKESAMASLRPATPDRNG